MLHTAQRGRLAFPGSVPHSSRSLPLPSPWTEEGIRGRGTERSAPDRAVSGFATGTASRDGAPRLRAYSWAQMAQRARKRLFKGKPSMPSCLVLRRQEARAPASRLVAVNRESLEYTSTPMAVATAPGIPTYRWRTSAGRRMETPRDTLGDFCQRTYHLACLFVRLRCRDNRCIARLCACYRSLKTNANPTQPGMFSSGNRLSSEIPRARHARLIWNCSLPRPRRGTSLKTRASGPGRSHPTAGRARTTRNDLP